MRKPIRGVTPLSLFWSFKHPCALKDEFELDDLLTLERKFRPLQYLGLAESENRICGDVCLDRTADSEFEPLQSVKGFSIEEISYAYGGTSFLNSCCGNCPANIPQALDPIEPGNANESRNSMQYAGCYGQLQMQYGVIDLAKFWNSIFDPENSFPQEALAENVSEEHVLPKTNPPLFSIWLQKQLSPLQCAHFQFLLREAVQKFLPATIDSEDAKLLVHDAQRMLLAVKAAVDNDIPLQLEVIPAAMADEKHWRVPQHCSDCAADATDWSGRCPTCKSTAPPQPPRKRHLRGDRPYWQIYRFLGEDGARSLIDQYRQAANEKLADRSD